MVTAYVRDVILTARSRLTIRILSKALDGDQSFGSLSLAGWMMPKSKADEPPLRISHKVVERIAADIPRQRVEDAIEWLGGRYPDCLWPASMAAEYCVLKNDPGFGCSHLSRHVRNATTTSARCIAQLAALQMEAGQTAEAQRTLTTFAPQALHGGDNSAGELDLLSANAFVGDETQWLSHVNRFLARAGLEPLSLHAGSTDMKFRRLVGGIRHTNDGRVQQRAKVSVIVSCYNAEEHLETSLRSLMAQTYANLEIIAVDDCSSDSTWDLLTVLAAGEPRIRLLRNPKNVGTYVSRNRALRASSGSYVTTQDSDDWSHPTRIERQVSLLDANPSAVADYCAGVRMWEDGRFETHKLGELVRGVCYPSLMYRKDAILERAGYWDCVRAGADSEYLNRIVYLYGKDAVLGCGHPLIIQLRRDGSLTTLSELRLVGGIMHQNRRVYAKHAKQFLRSAPLDKARYAFEPWVRPFPAPEVLAVPEDLVREAAGWTT